ncbi:NlpC/P60 family protein [Erythrobacter sp. W53]|uniref:NlpC/P60 family protein n=1 Tax=Erythrobacter sp. W53 TaxID=3425947 RepID=UPI003D766F3F
MSDLPNRFADAAQALVGVPFRMFGRSRETGLDCVGLVILALKKAGARADFAEHYTIRQTHIERLLPFAKNAGFALTTGPGRRGDMLLVRPGPAQHHLIIVAGENRFIHAHAGLRKIVEHPGPLAWPVLLHWQLSECEESKIWQP